MESTQYSILAILLAVLSGTVMAEPVPDAITYQGAVEQNGSPINGLTDFQFILYDSETSGNTVGSQVSVPETLVSDGVFTVSLNFGSSVFDGNERWLEIQVRYPCCTGSYTTLTPR